MTRQKREILREIDRIDKIIEAETVMGCGFTPVDAFKELYRERWQLFEKLAKLSHFNSAMEMFADERHIPHDEAVPFA